MYDAFKRVINYYTMIEYLTMRDRKTGRLNQPIIPYTPFTRNLVDPLTKINQGVLTNSNIFITVIDRHFQEAVIKSA